MSGNPYEVHRLQNARKQAEILPKNTLVMAFVAERASDARALTLAAGFALLALACFAAIRRSPS